MNRISKSALLIVILLVAISISVIERLNIDRNEAYKSSRLALLISGEEKDLDLQERNQFYECEANGPLPDPECTPGDIFPGVSKEIICVSGYSKTVRSVSVSLKKKVFEQYGLSYPQPFGSYEVDHLIPLSLGGSNEIANLWPKSAEPPPGFWEKNIVGNFLREEVCKNKIALSAAQEIIARDWYSVYQVMPNKKIQELKIKYPNWANRKR